MNADFYRTNRQRLAERLNAGIIVLCGYTATQRRGDASFSFDQEANFWYLCGIDYPDWQLIIDRESGESWLVMPKVDPIHALFDGNISDREAQRISGVSEVIDQAQARLLLSDLAKKHEVVYTLGMPPYARYSDFTLNPAPIQLFRRLKRLFKNVSDCRRELAWLRAIKQPQEIMQIKAAANLTTDALQHVKKRLGSYEYEYQIEADLTYDFRRKNAIHAFEPIIASGINACTLHYVKNDHRLQEGDLVLLDVGARLGEYSADCTRTFAIGHLNSRQDMIHHTLQRAQKQIVSLIRPGYSLKEYTASVDRIMKETLVELGLMKDLHDTDGFHAYLPHAVSHGLGLDVHESLGGYDTFIPSMVLTVEPGIYIPRENIGIRIEDDILVTEHGRENLTDGISTDF